jgi:hypothetical protein
VHGDDGPAHQQGRRRQSQGAGLRRARRQEGRRRAGRRQQKGDQRQAGIIEDGAVALEPQYGDEMHRPDADAQRQSRNAQPAQTRRADLIAGAIEQIQSRPSAQDRDRQRQDGEGIDVKVVQARRSPKKQQR